MNQTTISMKKANLMAIFWGPLLVSCLSIPFILLYGLENFLNVKQFFRFTIFIPSIVVGIIIHEAIHGLIWAAAAKIGLKNIKFGLQTKTLTPYAHSKVPMDIMSYRLGTVMPFIILGIIPYILALVSENTIVLGFSLFFSFVAIGDLIILWITRNISKDKKVQDHPTEGGVNIVE